MRLIIFLSTIPLLLLASYENTKEFYEAGEYEKATIEARASTSEYNNPQLHLLWAKSAQKLGRLDEAMSAYERVVMLDETNVDAKFELAQVYDKTSRVTLAKETSKELQNYQLTPEQRTALELIEGASIQKVKAKASLMLGHDSNINVSAASDKLSSLFTRFNGSVSLIDEFADENGAYARGDLKLYYQNNTDAHYYDMFIGSLDGGFGFRQGGYNIYVPVGIDKVNYLNTSLMLQYKFEPRVDISLDKNYIVNVATSYKKRVYNEAKYEIMNDSSLSVGFGLYYMMDRDFIYFNAKYESFSSSEDVHALYIDKDMITISLGANYNLNSWLVSRLDYRYRSASYSDQRDDDYHQAQVKFSHFFKDKYEIFVSDRYLTNSSNYVPANYTKNIAILGLSMSY